MSRRQHGTGRSRSRLYVPTGQLGGISRLGMVSGAVGWRVLADAGASGGGRGGAWLLRLRSAGSSDSRSSPASDPGLAARRAARGTGAVAPAPGLSAPRPRLERPDWLDTHARVIRRRAKSVARLRAGTLVRHTARKFGLGRKGLEELKATCPAQRPRSAEGV